jgi:hypothetical protein
MNIPKDGLSLAENQFEFFLKLFIYLGVKRFSKCIYHSLLKLRSVFINEFYYQIKVPKVPLVRFLVRQTLSVRLEFRMEISDKGANKSTNNVALVAINKNLKVFYHACQRNCLLLKQ